jgi:hypothetical protein
VIDLEAVGRKHTMIYTGSLKFLFAVIFACGLFAMALPAKAQQRPQPMRRENESENDARGQRRLAPPSGLGCDVDHITSFTGRVLSYSRRAGQVFIRIRTDEAKTQEFTITYARDQDLSKRFKLNGESLAPGGLAKIEARWERDKRNVRATVWACYDNERRKPSASLIDWQIGKRKPPETL